MQITYLTKGYRSKIYKEFSKLNKKGNSPIKYGQNIPVDALPTDIYGLQIHT